MFDLEQAIADWRRQLLATSITPAALDELECHLREEIGRWIKSGLPSQTAFTTAAQQMGPPKLLKTEFNKNGLRKNKAGIFALIAGLVILFRILMVHHATGPEWKGDQVGWILFASMILFWSVSGLFFGLQLGGSREVRFWKLVAIAYSAVTMWIILFPILRYLEVPRFAAAFGATDRFLAALATVVSLASIFIWRWGRRFLPVIQNPRRRVMLGVIACLLGPGAISGWYIFVFPQMAHVPAAPYVVLNAWAFTAMTSLAGLGYGLAEAADDEASLEQPLSLHV